MIEVTAPMVGKVLRVEAPVGTRVKENDVVLVLEAMKMHVEVYSPGSGVVSEVLTSEGEVVKAGSRLMVLE
ncbi:hypothetical protein SY88_15945 [Clostridiales bacterium PH28_bin88]|nr:hypothetical protein SY88_15945 [Clostridiales bacterium PH28_bin88]